MNAVLAAKLTADPSQFNRAMRLATIQARSLGTDVAKVAGVMASASGGFFAVSSAVGAAKSAMEKYGKVADQVAASGMDPVRFQQYANAAELCGASMDDVTTASLKLSKAIQLGAPTDASTQALVGLGLKISELKAMDADSAFEAVAKALGAIENPTQKAAIAMEIFGKGAKSVLPVLDEINNSSNKFATLTAGQVKSVDSLGDAFTRMGQAAQAAWGRALAGIYDAATPGERQKRIEARLHDVVDAGNADAEQKQKAATLEKWGKQPRGHRSSRPSVIDTAKEKIRLEASAADRERAEKNTRTKNTAMAERLARISKLATGSSSVAQAMAQHPQIASMAASGGGDVGFSPTQMENGIMSGASAPPGIPNGRFNFALQRFIPNQQSKLPGPGYEKMGLGSGRSAASIAANSRSIHWGSKPRSDAAAAKVWRSDSSAARTSAIQITKAAENANKTSDEHIANIDKILTDWSKV